MPPILKRSRMNRVKSREALAKRYGVIVVTIGNWLNAGAPRKKGGYYNLTDWDAWVAKYKSAESGKDDTLAAVTLELKKADLWEKNRLRAEYELKMVDGEQVEREWEAFGKHLVATLLRWPPQVGSILGVEAQRRALVIVAELLRYIKENPLGVHK